MAYTDVKITDLPPVSNVTDGDLLLVAHPQVDSTGAIQEIPYTSNSISVGKMKTALGSTKINLDASFVGDLENPLCSTSDFEGRYGYSPSDPSLLSSASSVPGDSVVNKDYVDQVAKTLYNSLDVCFNPYGVAGTYPCRYNQINIGNNGLMSSDGVVGVFDSKVWQISGYGNSVGRYHCANVTLRNPLSSDLIPSGTVMSDGHVFYYKTVKDCIALINLTEVTTLGHEMTRAWILYNNGKTGVDHVYKAINAFPIIARTGITIHHDFPWQSIAIPVKAGTVFAFTIYCRQAIRGLTYYENAIQAPVNGPIRGMEPMSLYGIYHDTNPHTFSYMDHDGHRIERDTYMIRADGSGILGVLASATGATDRLYDYRTVNFSTVADIWELA